MAGVSKSSGYTKGKKNRMSEIFSEQLSVQTSAGADPQPGPGGRCPRASPPPSEQQGVQAARWGEGAQLSSRRLGAEGLEGGGLVRPPPTARPTKQPRPGSPPPGVPLARPGPGASPRPCSSPGGPPCCSPLLPLPPPTHTHTHGPRLPRNLLRPQLPRAAIRGPPALRVPRSPWQPPTTHPPVGRRWSSASCTDPNPPARPTGPPEPPEPERGPEPEPEPPTRTPPPPPVGRRWSSASCTDPNPPVRPTGPPEPPEPERGPEPEPPTRTPPPPPVGRRRWSSASCTDPNPPVRPPAPRDLLSLQNPNAVPNPNHRPGRPRPLPPPSKTRAPRYLNPRAPGSPDARPTPSPPPPPPPAVHRKSPGRDEPRRVARPCDALPFPALGPAEAAARRLQVVPPDPGPAPGAGLPGSRGGGGSAFTVSGLRVRESAPPPTL
ncbi:uncharacterized protein [Saccopteryx leptura]|uniref:uncharacterized protein n=1 Tax=Saccopteryx leptura TaxID=249018 RepID=UPI00339CF2ED